MYDCKIIKDPIGRKLIPGQKPISHSLKLSFIVVVAITQHAPGVPKILVGNRLHLAYKRQVTTEQAQVYAEKLGVTFFEVSPLCNFNITESFTELARIVLMRHGMDRLWRPNKGEGQGRGPGLGEV